MFRYLNAHVHRGWLCGLAVLFCYATVAHADEEPAGKLFPPPDPNGKARLEPLEPPFDFGPVRSSQVKSMTHTFQFRNAGTETLKILRITPSCECTAAVLSASDIAPGMVGSITTAIEIKGESGVQSVTVKVHTNDPTHPVFDFELRGYLLADWKTVPNRLDLGSVGPGETVSKSVTIQSEYLPGEPTFQITSIESDQPNVSGADGGAGPGPDLTEGKYPVQPVQRNVVATVKAAEEKGPGQATLTLRTNDPAQPAIEIPVTWAVGGDFAFKPEKLFLLQRGTTNPTRELVITSRSGSSFEIDSILSIGEDGTPGEVALEPKSGTSDSQKVFDARGAVQTTEKRVMRKGTIQVQIKGSSGQTLSIPYTVTATGN